MSNSFTIYNENFKSAFIVENVKMTRSVNSRNFIGRNFFPLEFFNLYANKILNLKYSDFYTVTDNMIPAVDIIANTGIPLSVLMIQTLRGVCTSAKTKYNKKAVDSKKTVDLSTFIYRKRKGSSHLRKVLCYIAPTEIPHNIVKFSTSMDIVINETQSRNLNSIWTNNLFSNQTKTFLFKLHNNTLGYNVAVAHFVRGHSPNCTFCDIVGDQNINAETGLHLFLECEQVEGTVNHIFDMFTGTNGFEYSRREYFSTFERRNFSIAQNYLLTIVSKLIMKIIWDCRNHSCTPDRLKCWSVISDELKFLKKSNKKFENLLEVSGFNIF
jgi:hypothetical protein